MLSAPGADGTEEGTASKGSEKPETARTSASLDSCTCSLSKSTTTWQSTRASQGLSKRLPSAPERPTLLPCFRKSCSRKRAFERGELRSKEGGKKSIHFNGSHEHIELLLRTVISANQLSIYGAIADLCDEVPKGIRAPEKPAAPDYLGKMEIPTDLSIAENSTNAQQRRNLRQEYYERQFEQWSEDQKSSKLCSDAGLKLVERGQYFYSLEAGEGQQMQHLCRKDTMPRNEKGTPARGWIRKNTRIGPVLNTKVCYRHEQHSVEVQIPSLLEDDYRFVGQNCEWRW